MTFTRYTLLALLLSLLWLSALAADQNLPDIGSPADSVLSKEQEQRLGRSIYNSLRQSGSMVTDPEIQEYIQSVGQRLSAAAQNNNFRFTFFVIDSPSINAFAIPGGYIGVHTGLILATRNESELAGVLGHEVAHVTQRHISRAIFASKQESIISLATMLGAVLLGAATGNGDVIAGGVLGSQSMSAQQQINFTRDNEYEADRVGIEFLSASGFNPNGMPDFFETLARKSAGGSEAPEFLRTHPVTVNRIAETRARATMLNFSSVTDSISYSLTRARIRLLTSKTPEKALDYFEAKLKDPDDPGFLGHEYGMALALYDLGRYREAKTILERLMRTHEGVIHFHTGYAATQAALGDKNGALSTLKQAITLFPRNVPLTIRYAELLAQDGQPKAAHKILLDLYNQVPPTPEQVRQIALTANAAGDIAESHYYMAEYHIMSGSLMLASDQLVMALQVEDLDSVQKARYESRLEQIQEYMPKRNKKR